MQVESRPDPRQLADCDAPLSRKRNRADFRRIDERARDKVERACSRRRIRTASAHSLATDPKPTSRAGCTPSFTVYSDPQRSHFGAMPKITCPRCRWQLSNGKADRKRLTNDTSPGACSTSLLLNPTRRLRNRMCPHSRTQSRGGIPSNTSKSAIKIQKNLKSTYHSSFQRIGITARIRGRNISELLGGPAKDIIQSRQAPSGFLSSRKGS